MAIERLLPECVYLGQHNNFNVCHVLLEDSDFDGEGERLLRFVLPPFQRSSVWKRSQQVKFMESLILGMPIGTYCYSLSLKNRKVNGWLIDGQQRIRAIEQYVNDAFPVFGFLYSQLTKPDHRRIENMSFGAYVLTDVDEKELLERYISLNYSGTPHTDSDKRRAKRILAASK